MIGVPAARPLVHGMVAWPPKLVSLMMMIVGKLSCAHNVRQARMRLPLHTFMHRGLNNFNTLAVGLECVRNRVAKIQVCH
jgi:hypothetical protein